MAIKKINSGHSNMRHPQTFNDAFGGILAGINGSMFVIGYALRVMFFIMCFSIILNPIMRPLICAICFLTSNK
jgi:hypothetical protein